MLWGERRGQGIIVAGYNRRGASCRSRERENLVGERTRIGNRIKSTLARLGIRGFKPTLRTAAQPLERLPTPEGDPVPPNTLAELRRERARLCLLADQIREIETARLQRLNSDPIAAPIRWSYCWRGFGVLASRLPPAHEAFSRSLRAPPGVARYGALTGSPDESGARRREKGLARPALAANKGQAIPGCGAA